MDLENHAHEEHVKSVTPEKDWLVSKDCISTISITYRNYFDEELDDSFMEISIKDDCGEIYFLKQTLDLYFKEQGEVTPLKSFREWLYNPPKSTDD